MKKIITTILTVGIMAANSCAALIISNAAATTLTTTSMVFNATVASTNGTGTNPTCVVFYGTVDYTTNAASWAYSNVCGVAGVGNISTQVTGLSASHKYYFAWRAIEGSNTDWATPSLNAWTKPSAPTSTPAVVTISLQTDTDAVLKSPTNFFKANSNLLVAAIGGVNTDSNAVWGNITGTLANQLDLTQTVALAAAAYPSNNPSAFTNASVTNDLDARVTGHITNTVPHVSASDRTNWDGKATLADVAAVGYLTNSGAGTITNLVSTDGSVAIASPGGPQPDLSVASWVTNTSVVSNLAAAVSNDLETTKSNLGAISNAYLVIAGSTNVTVTPTLTGQVVSVSEGGGVADLSAWSSYAATQQVAWAGYWFGMNATTDVFQLRIDAGDLAWQSWYNGSNVFKYPIYVDGNEVLTNGASGAGLSGITAAQVGAFPDASGVVVSNLAVSVSNFAAGVSNTAAAALPKTATNALAVTALQITGGSPTTGAVFIVTNMVGQGKLSSPIYFRSAFSVPGSFSTAASNVICGTAVINYGSAMGTTSFVAPVRGIYYFLGKALILTGSSIDMAVVVDGTSGASTRSPGTAARTAECWAENVLLNAGQNVWLRVVGADSSSIYIDINWSYFAGGLIRELP